jgi:peptidoglycan hydrolase-like protein with peptidoglycan-binding domain
MNGVFSDEKHRSCDCDALGAAPRLGVDGQIGEATRAAVKAFQAAHQLPQTGLTDLPGILKDLHPILDIVEAK